MFNFLIVGPTKSGKSTYFERLNTGNYSESYSPTINSQIQNLTLRRSGGTYNIKLFDGIKTFDKLDIDGIILMFDINTPKEQLNIDISKWLEKIPTVPTFPIVICFNKYDTVKYNDKRS